MAMAWRGEAPPGMKLIKMQRNVTYLKLKRNLNGPNSQL